jgi:hypothetical protein
MTAFPASTIGSASTSPFSEPAQRSLHVAARMLAESPYVTLYTEGFSRFVTSTTAPIATGRSESCRVGLFPTERSRFHGARKRWVRRPLSDQLPHGIGITAPLTNRLAADQSTD